MNIFAPVNTTNYQYRFSAQATPAKVYDAITRVREWWTINTDGNTIAVGDVFSVEFGDVRRSEQRITEAIPGKRIVWRVTQSNLPWLKDREEWKGTEVVFDIAATNEGAELSFTHIGLAPHVECFEQCEKGCDYFIGTSLFKLITEGSGLPGTTQRSHMDTIGHVYAPNT